ncbi:Asp23/Gls24 family envelope stress response protein [Nocardiopsis sp. RSe5-2]|uniref:Asp23/Gls24 family envelope stress response protein n=1 Tax=Nocardiopsis endophytica TaxID=3018445 RepID=A0ABT4UDI1_9ACTN|nr:Asp23/Gls24 family envelope stress response protein [Nocardiopsis endophytica]MDA2814942.1 Asp23/Gls24 family envelope stress response protein [Nocardiopsis endophytica]
MTEVQNREGADSKVPEARSDDRAADKARGQGRDLVTGQGRTEIADHVVAKIAGMAAREVRGVHAMGGGAARAFGAVRDRIASTTGGDSDAGSAARGVSVEVGETQAAVDIDLVVSYGVSIPDLASAVRRNVIGAVERMTGLEVTEVNVSVDDIHLPDDEAADSGDDAPRVR